MCLMIVLDQLRKKGNLGGYSDDGMVEKDAEACIRTVEKLAATVKQRFRANRPKL